MTLRPVEVDFNESWGRLRNTLESVILLNNVNKAEWSERFSDVYKMCVAKPTPYPDELYEETKKFIINHVKKLHSQICLRVTMGDNLLVNYYHEWLVYRDGIQYMDKLYMYLNNQHLKKLRLGDSELNYGYADAEDQKLEIGELGLSYWRKYMIEPLSDDLVNLLLRAFENDRLGNPTNESVIQGVIESFVMVEQYKKKEKDLYLYRDIFETPFLEATRKYYSREASTLLALYDCSQYMEKVLQRLDSEILRSRKYLHNSSHAKVSEVCEEEMVAKHLDFLHAECQRMVVSESRKDLHNMFKLLKPIGPGIQHLVSEVQKHFTKIGLDAIVNLSGENIANSFVENLLEVYRKQRDLINDVFNSDQQFIGALDKACSYVINHRVNPKVPCRSAELLARYCDSLLKKTSKRVNEFEIDEKLRRSITIFKYIDDKDVFQKFYAKMLAKRLIHSQSVSMDSEESMINKLKQACGHEFTSKLHRMFTDVKISNDLNGSFSDWLKVEKRDLGRINFNIFVLQAGAWPLAQNLSSPFAMPQILEKSCSNFESFYNETYHGRKLTFLHHLSTCEVKCYFGRRAYLASMSTFYMAILILFENTNKLSFKEIQLSTNLTEDLLSKHLCMLIEMKLLNLDHVNNPTDASTSSPLPNSGKSLTNTNEEGSSPTLIKYTFEPETQLTLNHGFVSKRARFKILAVNQKEVTQQQEVEQTHSSVDEDRKLFLQAAVVRIMKARKIMKHNQLIQEVIDQAKNRFGPSIPMVKKCIEALIEKQYLERTAAQDEYSYIA